MQRDATMGPELLFNTRTLQQATMYSSGENFLAAYKISLIKFLVSEWRHLKYQQKISGKSLFVTCEDACYKLTADSWEEVAELRCSHEEADARLLLHAKHTADVGSKAVIIIAEDTDVLILSLAYCKDIPCFLYQKCGTQNRTRFIDITKLNITIGDSTCKALVGLHAFTGCNTVSAFSGRGKLVGLRQMKKDSSFVEAFSELGQTWEVSPELFENIVLHLPHVLSNSQYQQG